MHSSWHLSLCWVLRVLISPSLSRQLNEFRKFIGLKPLVSFKQWNPDPTVWKVAERLYKDIDVRLIGSLVFKTVPYLSSPRTWNCTLGCKRKK
jgi:hypothetical protein